MRCSEKRQVQLISVDFPWFPFDCWMTSAIAPLSSVALSDRSHSSAFMLRIASSVLRCLPDGGVPMHGRMALGNHVMDLNFHCWCCSCLVLLVFAFAGCCLLSLAFACICLLLLAFWLLLLACACFCLLLLTFAYCCWLLPAVVACL